MFKTPNCFSHELWNISELRNFGKFLNFGKFPNFRHFFFQRFFLDKNVFLTIFFFKEFFIAFKTIRLYKSNMYRKIVRKNLKKSFWEKLLEKFGTAIFGHSEFIPFLWEKLLGKIWNDHFWPFQIYTSLFGKSCQKKFGMAIFQSFWTKLSEKIWNSQFSVHITLIECNGLESNEICTFLDFYSEI